MRHSLVHVASLHCLCLLRVAAAGTDDSVLIGQFIQHHCLRCHGEESPEADIDLRGWSDQRSLLKSRDVWLRALEQVTAGTMPPSDESAPAAEERAAFARALERMVLEVDWEQFHNPGRLSLARLTAVEYRHAIRDLFGVDLHAGQLLGKDPEGNTGFTNDRDSLTFPVFAFDDFLSEAERAVDGFLTYGREPWRQAIEMETAWAQVSDKSTALTEDGSAVVLKDRNSPFQLNLDVPYPGLYRLNLRVSAFEGEPLSAMSVVVNGRLVERLVVNGRDPHVVSAVAYLTAGANVVSLGFDPDRAPILQPNHEPHVVPKEIARLAEPRNFKPLELPARLKDNAEAKRAWDRLNNVMKGFLATQRLAELLVERGETDYERHTLVDGTAASSISTFSTTKVPFNLAAGKVAVFLDVPQSELEQQLQKSHGFSHAEFVNAVRTYDAAWREKHPDRVRKKAGLIALDRVEVSSHARGTSVQPAGVAEDDFQWVFAGDSPEHAALVLETFGRRAYGRDVRQHEFEALLSIYRQTRGELDSHIDGLRDALVGLLVSPPFLVRYTAPEEVIEGRVGDHELARRLARFLWLSIPDETLLTLADDARLHEPEVLRAQAARMLDDPRFDPACAQFVEQWLNLDALQQYEDAAQIPASVVLAMREEPVRLIQHVLRENRPLTDLIACDYSFLNGPLARHYELAGVDSTGIELVRLKDRRRGGLLTMGAVHLVTSTPERTSPVNRGVFVVELILGEHLPAAPASVPELKAGGEARTVREELELHRSVEECAACHRRIDPYGFAFEHYDQFSRWRNQEGRKPVDASTVLPDGTLIDGLEALQTYIMQPRRDEFLRNMAVRMFQFALGRSLDYTDEAALRNVVDAVKADGDAARTLVYGIIQSDAFRSQIETRTP